MILNLTRINYDGDSDSKGDWWCWKEICNCCGSIIHDETTQALSKPTKEDIECGFCVNCMQNFRKQHISYKEAKKIYSRSD